LSLANPRTSSAASSAPSTPISSIFSATCAQTRGCTPPGSRSPVRTAERQPPRRPRPLAKPDGSNAAQAGAAPARRERGRTSPAHTRSRAPWRSALTLLACPSAPTTDKVQCHDHVCVGRCRCAQPTGDSQMDDAPWAASDREGRIANQGCRPARRARPHRTRNAPSAQAGAPARRSLPHSK